MTDIWIDDADLEVSDTCNNNNICIHNLCWVELRSYHINFIKWCYMKVISLWTLHGHLGTLSTHLLWLSYLSISQSGHITSTHLTGDVFTMCFILMMNYTGWAKKTGLFSDLITLWRLVLERRAVCQNFRNFIEKKRYKTRILESLNILCQICSNRYNSWNYGIYDQNTWILLNLH